MIKRNNILVLLLFSIILLAAVSAASASELDATDDFGSADQVADISAADENVEDISTDLNPDEISVEEGLTDSGSSDNADLGVSEEISESSDNGEISKENDMDNGKILGQTNEEILSASSKNFTELSNRINETDSGSTLYLDSNYTCGSNEMSITISKPITIDGNGFTIDCMNRTRIFYVSSPNVTFKNLILKHGGTTDCYMTAGAIWSNYLSYNTTAINCTFSYCNGYEGGAVNNVYAINCTFDHCRSLYYGAAMAFGNATNCNFTYNKAGTNGGAIYRGNAIGCNFKYNNASSYGGAIYQGNAINCNFTYNNASSYGGAICQGNAIDCNFSYNKASNGAAMYQGNATNCNFNNNTASNCGGVGYFTNAENCNFTGNRAGYGGAMYYGNATNCNFTYNNASSNGGAINYVNAVNCTLEHNYGYYGGGSYYGNATNCTFNYNDAYYGGGKCNGSAINCTFTNNHASSNGGGIYGGEYIVCIFEDNTAPNGVNAWSSSGRTPKILLNYEDIIYMDYPSEPLDVSVRLQYGAYEFEGIPISAVFEKSGEVVGSYPVLSGSSITLNFDTAGWYYIGFYLNSTRYQVSCYNYLEVKVIGEPTHFNASNMVINAGSDEYFEATLMDSQNRTLAGYTVLYAFDYNYDGIRNSTKTDENGKIRISLKGLLPRTDSHSIDLFFNGSEEYESLNTYYSIKVKGIGTKIIVPVRSVTKVYGQEYLIEATLLDENGNPLAGRVLHCLGRNFTTNESGTALVSLKYQPYGSSNVGIDFNGDETYENAHNWTAITVSRANVSFNVTTAYIHRGESINYTVQLLDQFGNPASGVIVNYSTSYDSARKYVFTDENGKFNVTIPDTLNYGTYYIYLKFQQTISYNGITRTYSYNSGSSSATIVVKRYTPQINASDKRVIFNITGEKLIVTFLNESGIPMEGFDLNINLNGQTNTLRTNGSGQVSLDIPILPEGVYPININYVGSESYDPVGKTVYLEVSKRITFINASDINLIYNQTTTLVAVFYDELDNLLTGFDLSVNFNGNDFTKTTNGTGEISIDIPVLDGNTYPLTISFLGGGIYKDVTKVVYVNVAKWESIILANNLTTDYNSGEYLLVTLKDNAGNLLQNRSILAKAGGQKLSQITDENGQAKFVFNIAPKTWQVSISFEGDGIYNATSTTASLTVRKIINDSDSGSGANSNGGSSSGSGANSNGASSGSASKIATKLYAPKVTAVYKVSKYMVATLKDKNGKVLKNAKVSIKINGKTFTKTTNSYGKVKLLISNLVPKKYTAIIKFAGDKKHYNSSAKLVVLVKKAKPKLILKKKTFKVKTKTKKYAVTLKTNKGKALKKAKLTLRVKGKTYKAKTNKKGKAKFKISKLTKKGTFKAVVKFAGNKYYKKLRKTVKLTVK